MSILNTTQVKQYLPHRYPFLFVDAVDELELNKYIIARKAVTAGELVFGGHFPGNPIFPGVLQVEAMGQAGALLAILSGAKLSEDSSIYATGVQDCKFKRPVVPGDVMMLRAEILKVRLGLYKLGCEVRVDGALCTTALVSATIGPKPKPPALPEGLPPPLFDPS